MNFTLDLSWIPELSTRTWIWSGVGVYCAICWLIIGPGQTRWSWRNKIVTRRGELIAMWAFSPILQLIVMVLYPTVIIGRGLIFGIWSTEPPK